MIKEACVGNYIEARKAEELGADRIELCDNLRDGGTTPSYGTIKLAKETLNMDISVIIRPRGGDFTYSEGEIKIMEEDIEICKKLKVQGVVFGVLIKNNEIDEEAMKRLMKKAEGLKVTFHMAFDMVDNKEEGLDTLVDLGVDRVLTKGGMGRALDNEESLKKLVEYSNNRIIILAGGGVTKDNYKKLVENTGVTQVHGTKIVGKLA